MGRVKNRTVSRVVAVLLLAVVAGGLARAAHALLAGVNTEYGRGAMGPVEILVVAGVSGTVVTAVAFAILAAARMRKRLGLVAGAVTVLAVATAGAAGASAGADEHRLRAFRASVSCSGDVDRNTLEFAETVGRVVPVDGRRANGSPQGCRVLVAIPRRLTDDPVGHIDGTASAIYWQISGPRAWTSDSGHTVQVERVERASGSREHLVTLLGTGPRLADSGPHLLLPPS